MGFLDDRLFLKSGSNRPDICKAWATKGSSTWSNDILGSFTHCSCRYNPCSPWFKRSPPDQTTTLAKETNLSISAVQSTIRVMSCAWLKTHVMALRKPRNQSSQFLMRYTQTPDIKVNWDWPQCCPPWFCTACKRSIKMSIFKKEEKQAINLCNICKIICCTQAEKMNKQFFVFGSQGNFMMVTRKAGRAQACREILSKQPTGKMRS